MSDFAPPRWPGDTRPDFAEGNRLRLTHGANSKRVITPLAAIVAEETRRVAPWTDSPLFADAVDRYAIAKAIRVLRFEALDDGGIDGPDGADGDERPGTQRLERALRHEAACASALGLDPPSLVRLLSGLSSIDAPAAQSGLDALRKAGAALAVQAAQRALTAVPDGDGSDAA